MCDLDCDDFFFTLAPYSNTRGHNLKLIGSVCKNNWLFNFFTNRIVSYWNFLPAEVVNAESFKIFSVKLNSTLTPVNESAQSCSNPFVRLLTLKQVMRSHRVQDYVVSIIDDEGERSKSLQLGPRVLSS